jgi:DNA-binding FadR family transcriptional regulator
MDLALSRSGEGLAADRIRRRKTSDDIALAIVRYIKNQGLEEGAMLPHEARMAEILGVGRTTLREALRVLETQGVLTIKAGPRGGPVVRAPRPDDLKSSMTLLLQFHEASFETLMHARLVIEPAVAAAAAKRITKARLAELEDNLGWMEREHANGSDGWRASNEEFHVRIAEATGDVLLHIMVATIVGVFTTQRQGVDYEDHSRADVFRAHRRIVDALGARDAAGAEAAMRKHLTAAYTYIQKNYPQLMIQPVSWTG